MDRILGITEIEHSKSLKIIAYLLLFNLTFFMVNLFMRYGEVIHHPLCYPFWQNCEKWQTLFLFNFNPKLRGLFFIYGHSLIFIAFAFLLKDKIRHFYFTVLFFFFTILLPLFVVVGFHDYIFKYPQQYLFYITFIFLFASNFRMQYLRFFFVLTYFLAAISKFESDTWILGTLTLPFVDQQLVPILTNLTILFQLLMPVLLFSKNSFIRLTALFFLELFHIYTISMINIVFHIITTPFLFILFYMDYEKFSFEKFKFSFLMKILFLMLLTLNLIRLYIPHKDSITFEGAYIAFNMFQSEKGCDLTFVDKNMKTQTLNYPINQGNQHCDPYSVLTKAKQNCIDNRERSLNLSINHIQETYEIINVKNYCYLEYKPFEHNTWINPKLISQNNNNLTNIGKKIFPWKEYLSSIYFFILLSVILGFLYKYNSK